MKCIARFVDRTQPLPPETPAIAAAARFAGVAGNVLAIGSQRTLEGVIRRESIEKAIAIGLGQSPVRAFMSSGTVTIDLQTPSEHLGQALLNAQAEGEGAFVVIDRATYVGVGDVLDVVQGLLAQTLAQQEVDGAVQAVSDVEGAAQAAYEQFRGYVEEMRGEFEAQIEGVMAMTDLLLRQPLSRDALAQTHSIRASGEALLRLANDALDMAQAKGGHLELNPQPTQLRGLIDEVQANWIPTASDAGVSLLISYDGDPDLSVEIDAGRLRQIYDNVIGNALRYTRQGSVEVSLRARRDHQEVVLQGRVRDTSPGLTGAKLARIFDPSSDNRSEAAYNLPMSLTREIVQSMHGSIRAESNVGQGVTIVFDLIAPQAKASAAAALTHHADAVSAAHVLVVDDNATNRMVAEALCEMFDCTSESVEDGAEAVEAAASGRFDLILMDIKMPRMDGIAAAKAIRGLAGVAGQVPIVALTANVDPEDARSYLAAGMCGVVEKPIKPERLMQAITAALAQASSPDQVVAA